MRMHRGSSKEVTGSSPASEDLPLSASTRPSALHITVDVVRGGPAVRHALELPEGSVVRDALRAMGLFAESSSARVDGQPVPLDRPLHEGETLEVLRTFSGG